MEKSSSYIPPPADGNHTAIPTQADDRSGIIPPNSKIRAGVSVPVTTGSERLIEILIEQGVNTIFGYPGGVVLPIFDALYKSPINFVLSRHEQGATHMADGYARASGKVGVVLVTSGPGATNIITGLATAYMDSIPLVAITGQVKTHLIGNDAFQEADTTGISRPVTKYNYIVKDANDLARILREAFYIAQTGRPGPVLIDVPLDVTTNVTEVNHQGEEMYLPGYAPRSTGHIRQIKKAAEAINQTEKTLVYAGGGVILANASAELRKLVNKARFLSWRGV